MSRLLVVLALLGCEAPVGGPGRGSDAATPDAGANSADAGADLLVEPDASAPTEPDPSFRLAIETPDGECADLGVTGRATFAVRFVAEGEPGSAVAIWVDKPACDVAPFKYQELTLDESGRATFEVAHAGAAPCGDNLLGRWRAWVVDVDGPGESTKADVLFASSACAEAPTCAEAVDFCPVAP